MSAGASSGTQSVDRAVREGLSWRPQRLVDGVSQGRACAAGGRTIIETLDIAQRGEVLAVLREAFATHPALPPGMPQERVEALLALMLDVFGSAERIYLHGIRRDGVLACIAFSLDAGYEPKGLGLWRLVWGMWRILGWRLMRDFSRAMAKRPVHDAPHLELLVLGTLPAYQRQGLGRQMLRFLTGFAADGGYSGVVLDVAKDTVAHGFYAREGFVDEGEIALATATLVHMRRANDARACAEAASSPTQGRMPNEEGNGRRPPPE